MFAHAPRAETIDAFRQYQALTQALRPAGSSAAGVVEEIGVVSTKPSATPDTLSPVLSPDAGIATGSCPSLRHAEQL
jgi:hypothetical protein